MKQLIVNADDFALTANVSRAIVDAHQNGIVTSTTVLANGTAWADVAAANNNAPRLGMGVHLNLSEGLPISSAAKISSLIDGRGRLHLKPWQLWTAIVRRQARLSEIETELRAQVGRIVEAGIAPTHLDGHMHVHILPRVSQIAIRVAREFGITAMRCPVEKIRGISAADRQTRGAQSAGIKRRAAGLGISIMARRFKTQLDTAGLSYPHAFFGLFDFLDMRILQQILRSLPEGTSELMCHPGYVDADLTAVGGRLVAQREMEVAALTAPAIMDLVETEGVRLVSYRAVANRDAAHGNRRGEAQEPRP